MSSEGLSESLVPKAPGAPPGQSKIVLGGWAEQIVAGRMHSQKANTHRQRSFVIFDDPP